MDPLIVWKGPQLQLKEDPSSPETELAEKVTRTRTYRGLYTLCINSALPKGTFGTGAESGFIVVKSVVTREPKNIGKLVVTWAAGGEDGGDSGQSLPPDEYGIEPFEVNPPLEKHPYFSGFEPHAFDNVDVALNGADAKAKEAALRMIDGFEETAKLYELKRKGVETYYLSGFRYSWSLYFWGQPPVTAGGFIQAPGGPYADTIAALGLSCLRQADSVSFTGQHHKLTRTWLCGPNGHFDSVLYGT